MPQPPAQGPVVPPPVQEPPKVSDAGATHKAEFAFGGSDSWQVSLAEGEAITVIADHHDGWSEVAALDGRRGLVPTSYLSRLSQIDTTAPAPGPPGVRERRLSNEGRSLLVEL